MADDIDRGPTGQPNQPDPSDMAAMLRQFLQQGSQQPEIAEALRAMGVDPSDPRTLAALDAQMRAMFGQGGQTPDALAVATDVARKVVTSGEANDLVQPGQRQAVDDAVRVAAMWLDPTTGFDIARGPARALSRAEWVEATLPTWQRVTHPVAEGVTAAMESTIASQLGQLGDLSGLDAAGIPPHLAGMLGGMNPAALMGQLGPMVRTMARQMFAMQTGHAVGNLAADVMSGTEVGLPLLPAGQIALLPNAVTELADGLEMDRSEVLLYCAVREAARVTLFDAVPWLGPQLLTAVEEYARHITIDTDAIEEAVRSVDPSDPAALQAAVGDHLFRLSTTPAQQVALTRLETYLALSEGWVDVVSEAAVADRLPHAVALAETIRRRRVGGAASTLFADLVGLELRPRRLRDAANLWHALTNAGGDALRDAAWAHPDVAPAAADLDDPLAYVERLRGGGASSDVTTDLDAVLEEILRDADER